MSNDGNTSAKSNFIRAKIDKDLETDKYSGRVVTRFPPEPNGYLHIGHAKTICLNFGLALDYPGGRCNLRFDDTNPDTEDIEFVESIQKDVQWLGFHWGDNLFYASNYFDALYGFAQKLIQNGDAYICSLSEDEIREYRGTVQEAGKPSPYRDRSPEENLDLFARMKAGEFKDGEHVLRARIDMANPNMKMRDPLLYRIRNSHHYRTGDAWRIYPMYDFAHCLSDALERVTHSICTLEFENNRELYDWIVDRVGFEEPPEQTEMARLSLGYTVMSKRKLKQLVEEKHVHGWDDPRMPTVAGMRRRGYRPEAIREFCERIGIAKAVSQVDVEKLEFCVRDDLNFIAPRVMAVVDPLKVVIENYPEGQTEDLECPYYPHDVPKEGTRNVPFCREVFIERSDFMENATSKFFRLKPGGKVRLRYAYIIQCDQVIHDPETGEVTELRCSYLPNSKSGQDTSGVKVKGTIHWVSALHSVPAEIRDYDRLFVCPSPGEESPSFLDDINPASLNIHGNARVEPSLANDPKDTRYQFTRQGYYWQDPESSSADGLVFNQIVGLRSSWEKTQKKAAPQPTPKAQKTQKETPPAQPKKEVELSPEQTSIKEHFESLGVPSADAITLAVDPQRSSFFEEALKAHNNPQGVSNWVVNEVLREAKETGLEELAFSGAHIGELVSLIDDGTLSGKLAKDVFAEMLESGESPSVIVDKKGLAQIADPEALKAIIRTVMERQSGEVAAYRGGKTKLLGFFVGQVMKESRGSAHPALTRTLLEEALNESA